MLQIILLIITHYLSGYLVYRFFFNSSTTIKIIFIPLVLSLFITPATFLLFETIAGFDLALIIMPMVFIALFAFSLKFPKIKITKEIPDKKTLIIFAIFFLVVLLGASRTVHFSIISDPPFHMGASNEIINSKSLPPDSPCLPGDKFAYSWFSHLSASLFSIYTGSPLLAIYSYYGIYLFILFFFSSYILADHYLKNKNFRLLFLCLAMIYTIGFGSFFLHSPQSYALPFLSLIFYTLLISVKEDQKKYKVFAGFLSASLIYMHALSFSFSLLILVSISLYTFLYSKKDKVISCLCYLSPFIISIPYTLFLSSNLNTLYIFEPLAGIHSLLNYINYINILAIVLPFAAYAAIKKDESDQTVLLLSIITVLIFVNIFIMTRSPNIERNTILLFFPSTLLTLNYLQSSRRSIKIIVSAIAVIIFLQPAITDVTNTFFLQYSQPIHSIPEYNISMWIKDNSVSTDRILSAPIAIYSGLSERKAVVCNPDFLRGLNYNSTRLKSSFGDVLSLFNSPTKELVDKHNIKYIIFGPTEKAFLEKYEITPFEFSSSPAFQSIYQYGNISVYSIKDPGQLPKTSSTSSFTSRSRWWEI